MRIHRLFDNEPNPKSLPSFQKVELIPTDLDLTIHAIKTMPENDFKEYCENLRQYLLKVINSGHSIFFGNKDYNEIIDDCRDLINLNVDKLFKIINGKIFIKPVNLTVANQWFPMMISVPINDKSLLDQITNPVEFYKNIRDLTRRNRLKLGQSSFGLGLFQILVEIIFPH